eukprot:6488225-Amphidinium_carterae.1
MQNKTSQHELPITTLPPFRATLHQHLGSGRLVLRRQQPAAARSTAHAGGSAKPLCPKLR